jgi:hypothetical protein
MSESAIAPINLNFVIANFSFQANQAAEAFVLNKHFGKSAAFGHLLHS